MNIEILISVDGEQLTPNEELGSTIGQIVNSYIRQKISGLAPKKTKVPKDPNAPRPERRPHLSEDQLEQILKRAEQLTDKTLGGAAEILRKEFSRPYSTMYTYLGKAQRAGRMTFKKVDQRELQKQRYANAQQPAIFPPEPLPAQSNLRSLFNKK